ncbi:MAG: diguanylate cyclase [Helicobacteraceae bacterium]|nr:diguanylate cyclase [Helicobacteraceae bacterium]
MKRKVALEEEIGFFHKIRNRFLISIALVTVVLTGVIMYMLAKDYYEMIDKSAQTSLARLSESVFQTLYVSMNSGISEQVQEALREAQLKKLVDSLDLYISKDVIKQFNLKQTYEPPPEIASVFDGPSHDDRYMPITANDGERAMRYIKPFLAKQECTACHAVKAGTVLGVMDLTLSLGQFDDLSKQSLKQIVIAIFVLVAISGFLLHTISVRLLFDPIKELQVATKKLAKNAGEPNIQLTARGKNEFGQVARNFNWFITKVYDINNRLQLEEKKTKELLENREEEVMRRTKEVHELNKELMRHMDIVDENVITSRADLKGIITSASSAFCKISGYERDDLIGNPHNIVRHPDMQKELFADMWGTIQAGKVWRGEIKNRKKDGGSYWVRATISPLFNDLGEISSYLAVRYDISVQKELEATLAKLTEATKRSHTDALTGMINRLRINELLQMEIDRVERYGGDLCVALMDIDKFKNINDTYGHLIGDQVLIALAKILAQTMRKTDIAGRWGGEEFLIVLTHTPIDGAVKKLNSTRRSIEADKFDPVPKVTASFGVSSFQSGDTLESLVGRADVALYFAKESGRNCVKSTADTVKPGSIEVDLNEEK